MGSEEKQAQVVIDAIIPKALEAIRRIASDELPKLVQAHIPNVEKSVWDKAIAWLGHQMNLPVDVVQKLQSLDDIATASITKVEELKDRLKGVDLDKMIVLSYREIQKIRAKAAGSWAAITFLAGSLFGLTVLTRIFEMAVL